MQSVSLLLCCQSVQAHSRSVYQKPWELHLAAVYVDHQHDDSRTAQNQNVSTTTISLLLHAIGSAVTG